MLFLSRVSSSPRLLCVIVCFQVENIQIEIHLTRCLLNPNDRYIKYLFLLVIWQLSDVRASSGMRNSLRKHSRKILSLRNVEQCVFLQRTFISTRGKINSSDDAMLGPFVPAASREVAPKDQLRIISSWIDLTNSEESSQPIQRFFSRLIKANIITGYSARVFV